MNTTGLLSTENARVVSKFFGKKKKSFKAFCDISREPVEKGFGYLLTTAQVVSSQSFWNQVMTEEETMSYTISHFKNNDEMGTKMRSIIFAKHSGKEDPWIISDSYIDLFQVDKDEARANANKWVEEKGNYRPENTGPAQDVIESNEFRAIKEYAIMEAGRDRVPA